MSKRPALSKLKNTVTHAMAKNLTPKYSDHNIIAKPNKSAEIDLHYRFYFTKVLKPLCIVSEKVIFITLVVMFSNAIFGILFDLKAVSLPVL